MLFRSQNRHGDGDVCRDCGRPWHVFRRDRALYPDRFFLDTERTGVVSVRPGCGKSLCRYFGHYKICHKAERSLFPADDTGDHACRPDLWLHVLQKIHHAASRAGGKVSCDADLQRDLKHAVPLDALRQGILCPAAGAGAEKSDYVAGGFFGFLHSGESAGTDRGVSFSAFFTRTANLVLQSRILWYNLHKRNEQFVGAAKAKTL